MFEESLISNTINICLQPGLFGALRPGGLGDIFIPLSNFCSSNATFFKFCRKVVLFEKIPKKIFWHDDVISLDDVSIFLLFHFATCLSLFSQYFVIHHQLLKDTYIFEISIEFVRKWYTTTWYKFINQKKILYLLNNTYVEKLNAEYEQTQKRNFFGKTFLR